MEIMSKAKYAFQAVSAKAERVISDMKADASDFIGSIGSNSGSPNSNLSQGKSGNSPAFNKVESEKQDEAQSVCPIKMPVIDDPKDLEASPHLYFHTSTPSDGTALEDYEIKDVQPELAPKKEPEFWRRYFPAVRRVRPEVPVSGELSTLSNEDNIPDSTHLVVKSTSTPWRVETDASEEEAYQSAYQAVAIASSRVVRRLATAVGVARSVRSIGQLASTDDNNPLSTEQVQVVAEKLTASIKNSVGAGIAALGSLHVRERDKTREREKDRQKEMKKLHSGNMGEYSPLLWSLFEADTQYIETRGQETNGKSMRSADVNFIEEIHGAPPDSFVPQLAEIMAGIKNEQKMAIFWLEVVKELQQRWQEGIPIPRLPPDANPDMHTCLLNQQLQLINCCIARRERRRQALAALELVASQPMSELVSDQIDQSEGRRSRGNVQEGVEKREFVNDVREVNHEQESGILLVAKLQNGVIARRLGVAEPVMDLKLLETGEPLCAPVCQDGPVLTEDFVRETEELIMRTGSVGSGCSQLFSDMQAFKAANPGAIIEDFVRWYSPLDWASKQDDSCESSQSKQYSIKQKDVLGSSLNLGDFEGSDNARGFLSTRMQAEGNLWQELWQSAKAIPAARQSPLFDEELLGESTLNSLENIAPSDLFEQLFIAALGAGFATALSAPTNPANQAALATCLQECTKYVTATCTRGMSAAKLERLCQVYEVMETAVHTPPEGQNNSLWSSLVFVRSESRSSGSFSKSTSKSLGSEGKGGEEKGILEGDPEDQETVQREELGEGGTKGGDGGRDDISKNESNSEIKDGSMLRNRSFRLSWADRLNSTDNEGEWMIL